MDRQLDRRTYVTEVSEQDLTEVYHLLALLESDAAGLVAQRATDGHIGKLKIILEQLEATVRKGRTGREKFIEINEACTAAPP